MQASNLTLPISQILPQLDQAFQQTNQVVLKAQTGAGKSTHLPLSLLRQNKGRGKIILMEPRRLAAKSIASFLAQQLDEPLGQTVGYQIRGEYKACDQTRLLVVTEGIMTAMIQADPELSGVDLVIFDEFHERSIHADTSLAFCLESQAVFREDLKLLIMSATLDQETLMPLLPDAQYLDCPGRSYPVDISYQSLGHHQDVEQAVVSESLNMLKARSGSLLVFLDSRRSIRYVQNQLLSRLKSERHLSDVIICPLYGQLDLKAQQQAILPPQAGTRKLVLA
ncbi:MAG: DEAD/DEAH box helicase, partial [Vibrio sp.]